eukprot:904469-Amorphochlora_amoeboformis.AAC.1
MKEVKSELKREERTRQLDEERREAERRQRLGLARLEGGERLVMHVLRRVIAFALWHRIAASSCG